MSKEIEECIKDLEQSIKWYMEDNIKKANKIFELEREISRLRHRCDEWAAEYARSLYRQAHKE